MISLLYGSKGLISDTLLIHSNKELYLLEEDFIYPNSLIIKAGAYDSNPDSINFKKGIVYWNNDFHDTTMFIFKYEYLIREIPRSVSYRFNELENLSIIKKNNEKNISNNKNINQNSLYTSGSINRQLNLSSNGFTEFTGGLNLSLSGKLENDIMISATLSDEDIMIQPEGNTRNLEDFNQIYISLYGSNFSLTAGDIQYKNYIDELVNIERHVIGVNGKFEFNRFKSNSLIASTNGQYTNFKISAIDGVQGPYGLVSNTNNLDIQFIAGSEKVWLDGRKLIRGANYDYVIDYSQAEITFTARNLIHFDSDIIVDYEYIDDNYPKSILSTSYKTKISDNLNVVAGIHREIDNKNSLSKESELYQKMKDEGSSFTTLNGAIKDSSGKYFIAGGVYIYDPLFIQNDSVRYNVVFTYNSNGNYEKLVSELGEIYYSYVAVEAKNNLKDYFSPFQKISSPGLRDLYFAKINFNLGNTFSASSLISRSSKRENILSNNGTSNSGNIIEVNFRADSLELMNTKYGFSYTGLIRDKKYNSLNLVRDVQFNRIWDTDSINDSDELNKSFNLYIKQNDLSITNIKLSSLSLYDWNKKKLNVSHQILMGLFNGSNFNYSELFTEKGDFTSKNFLIITQLKYLKPFFKYNNEKRSRLSNYEMFQFGLDYTKNVRTISLSIKTRKDEYKNDELSNSIIISEDIFSSIKYIDKKTTGLRKNITITKRLYDKSKNEQLNYILGAFKINYINQGSPFQFDVSATTEQTQNETFSIVYDSVGAGLGEYRYDNSLKTYILDQNGSYISYSVPTGNRSLLRNIRGYQNLSLDLRKLRKRLLAKINFNTNFNFSGSKISINEIFDPEIDNGKIYRSYYSSLSEIDIGIKNFNRRIKFYSMKSTELQGHDPRGNEFLNSLKNGINGFLKIKENSMIKLESYYHKKNIESSFITERGREIRGFWNKISITLNEKKSESELSIKYGEDYGSLVLNKFMVRGIGFNYYKRLYIGKLGSVKLDFSLSENKELSSFQYIPPEAVNGQTLGRNISTNIFMNYFIKKDVSISLTINYIDNLRYDNLFTILGEFRAYL